MGIRKRTWYTVECNHCGAVLEDYTGDIAGLSNSRKQAETIAYENNWTKTGQDTWKCPECSNF